MYYALLGQMQKELRQMLVWFDRAEAHASAKSFPVDQFLGFRLAPDQFPLSRQIQIACDTAKLCASRLTGRAAPSHPDTESTLAELRARIESVLGYLSEFSEADFGGAAEIRVSQPRWEGKTMSGHDYFVEHAIPNFFFHTTHVYALFRHNGVELGKKDYLGTLSLKA